MRKSILLIAGLIAMTSCQKDYYLDDLNDAEAQINYLNNVVRNLESQINTLEAQANADAIHIADLTESLRIARLSIRNLTNANTALGEQITAHETEIARLLALLAELNDQLDELRSELVTMRSNADASQEEINRLSTQIVNLETTIDNFVPEIIEVIREVETIVYVENQREDRVVRIIAQTGADVINAHQVRFRTDEDSTFTEVEFLLLSDALINGHAFEIRDPATGTVYTATNARLVPTAGNNYANIVFTIISHGFTQGQQLQIVTVIE